MASFGAGGTDGFHNANKGYLVPQPPDDTVSRLRFSPSTAGDLYLVASSWNGSVRCWKVDSSGGGGATAVAMTERPGPVLDCAWAADGRAVFCAGADKHVVRWDLASGAANVVAAHEQPVRHVADVPEVNYIATASWDKSLKYWDVRAPTGAPVGTVSLAERAYAMDVSGPLMVLGLADRKLVVYDVRKPTAPFQEKYTQLRYQTRCVATWPDRMGYLVGSVDGKVSVDYVREPEPGSNYSFYCHRDKASGKVYAINTIRFHKPSGAFATGGSDGMLAFWDKDRKDRARTRRFERLNAPICDIDFAEDGRTYAYAVGYDWSMGASGNNASPENTYIVMDRFEDNELDGRGNGYNPRGRGRGGRRKGGGRR